MIFLLANYSYQKCMYYQPSVNSKPIAATTEEQQTPTIYIAPEDPMMAICYEYIGKKVCCNEFARTIMWTNFMKLGLIAECQNCLNNIKRMM